VDLSEAQSQTPDESRSPSPAWTLVRELPPRYQQAVAVAAPALTIACFVRFGFTGRAFVGAFFACVLVLLTAIDLHRRVIPNTIVVPALGLVLVAQIILYPERTLEWILAALGAGLFFYVPAFFSGIGMGDVKLAALVGATLGKSVVGAMFATLIAGAIIGLAVMAREGWKARRKHIPYGPFLVFGGLLVLLIGGR
jgi:prepilin signal peptidase PulO-like enzyme (type II secretory pathway)